MSNVVEVFNSSEGWMVNLNGSRRSNHRLKQSAEKNARDIAKRSRPSTLKIYNKQGDISYQQFYD